jgi:hypothetical protein
MSIILGQFGFDCFSTLLSAERFFSNTRYWLTTDFVEYRKYFIRQSGDRN